MKNIERNKQVREKLKSLLEDNGIMQIFVVKKTGISKTSINYFVTGSRDLTDKYLDIIEDFINKRL